MDRIITELNISDNITLITLNNIPIDHKIIARILTALAQSELNVDMISQTSPLKGKINISFTISDNDLFTAISTLKEFKKQITDLRIEVNSNNAKISLYGEQMKSMPGVAAKTMELLSENDVDIKMITTSEVDISYLIYASDLSEALDALKEIVVSK